jgi:hypothetical protein
MRVSAKLIRPWRGNVEPSASLSTTSKPLSLGSTRRPAATCLLTSSCSFSEMLNGTQIGSTCEITVSSVSFALTRLPSDFIARLDSPRPAR